MENKLHNVFFPEDVLQFFKKAEGSMMDAAF